MPIREWSRIVILVSSVVMWFGTPMMGVATLSYGAMLGGILFRKSRKHHVTLMSTAMVLDAGLVLGLALSRQAIRTAMQPSLQIPQQIHIVASLMAVSLYIPQIFLSFTRPHWHRRVGVVILVLRTIGLLFMFSMQGINRT